MFFKTWLENQNISLWLDDERDPDDPNIQTAFRSFPGMVWIKTVPEAIALLKQGNVEYISFDHDLGLPQTGYDLAKWIEEQAYYGNIPKLRWNVHSQNYIGKKDIIKAMKNADKYWNNI